MQVGEEGELRVDQPRRVRIRRIATHPSIFARPLLPAEALQNIEGLLALPHCRPIGEQQGFLPAYRDIALPLSARGNLVPDAHLATVLLQNRVLKLYTHDRDFRRFDFLTVKVEFMLQAA